jgi:small ligand-binding sensory domain FIST
MPAEHSTFRFASSLSTKPNLNRAIAEACGEALAELDTVPDLALLFLSADAIPEAEALATLACDCLGTEQLIGCTAESLVGRCQEVEGQTGVSLWLATMPEVDLQPIHLSFERTAEGGAILGWPDSLLDGWPAPTCLLTLGDPFSFPVELLLEQANQRQKARIVGGMASGASAPGENRLILGRSVHEQGAVTILISGAVNVRTVVSQGCRPIGQPFVITKCERNIIHQLGGKPAFAQLEAVYAELPTSDQRLVNGGLHLGRVISEYQDRFEHGDFLVRNVTGFGPETGSIAVGDYMRVGQTVQFHLRDAQTADADLKQLLAAAKRDAVSGAEGALLFTCNGRGTRLFPEPHHDALAIRNALGDIPLSGFFAAGELGPVGGENFIHGFTASIALFEQPAAIEASQKSKP